MLTLTGTLRAAVEIGGATKRDGTRTPIRSVLQLETQDDRGLVQVVTLYVPDHRAFVGREGTEVAMPVRAYAVGNSVNFAALAA